MTEHKKGKREPTGVESARILAQARLIDDDFMRVCLADAPECLEVIARAATGIAGLTVDRTATRSQMDLKSLTGRSLTMDFSARDERGRVYDIEIESAASSFPPKRARYHASMLDAHSLAAGQSFSELPDAYIIVISENDKLGFGRLRTTFRRSSEEGEPLGDGSAIIYVNCGASDNTPLGTIAHDFLCVDPSEMVTPALAKRAALQKQTEEVKMPKTQTSNIYAQKLIDDNYNNGVHDGYIDGVQDGREDGISYMIDLLEELGADSELIERARATASMKTSLATNDTL